MATRASGGGRTASRGGRSSTRVRSAPTRTSTSALRMTAPSSSHEYDPRQYPPGTRRRQDRSHGRQFPNTGPCDGSLARPAGWAFDRRGQHPRIRPAPVFHISSAYARGIDPPNAADNTSSPRPGREGAVSSPRRIRTGPADALRSVAWTSSFRASSKSLGGSRRRSSCSSRSAPRTTSATTTRGRRRGSTSARRPGGRTAVGRGR
jgi:hypothetical protein